MRFLYLIHLLIVNYGLLLSFTTFSLCSHLFLGGLTCNLYNMNLICFNFSNISWFILIIYWLLNLYRLLFLLTCFNFIVGLLVIDNRLYRFYDWYWLLWWGFVIDWLLFCLQVWGKNILFYIVIFMYRFL